MKVLISLKKIIMKIILIMPIKKMNLGNTKEVYQP